MAHFRFASGPFFLGQHVDSPSLWGTSKTLVDPDGLGLANLLHF